MSRIHPFLGRMQMKYLNLKLRLGLILALIRHPTYRFILAADFVIPPSPWCEDFVLEVDCQLKTIRLRGEFT